MQQIPILILSAVAAAAVAPRRFIAYPDANGRSAQAGAGAVAMGVSEYGVEAGKQFPVNALGTTIVEAGGAFAAGQEVQSDAQGRAILKAAGVTLGRALQPSAGAGSMVEILQIRN